MQKFRHSAKTDLKLELKMSLMPHPTQSRSFDRQTHLQCVIVFTCETMLDTSPEFDGSNMVFVSLARLENAAMYCSATVMDTAFRPC